MRVALLSTFHLAGGAAVAASRLHRALLRSGIDSTLLVGAPRQQERWQPEAGAVSLTDTLLTDGLAMGRFVGERLAFLPHEKDSSVRFLFSPGVFGTGLSHHHAIEAADVIHLHWTTFGMLSVAGIGALLRLGKPVVWTMHDMWAFTGGCHHSGLCERYQQQCGECQPFLKRPQLNDLSHRVWQRKQRAYAAGTLTPVACSEWLAGRARQSRLFGSLDVQAIPNPLDTDQFIPIDKMLARQELGVQSDKRLILFAAAKVGAAGKGFTYFREALTRLHAQLPNPAAVELLIFGAGDASQLRELPFRYHFLGPLSDVRQISLAYSAADLFVIPSLFENLPNTIMESMACGTPVVGFEVGGIPEMIRHRQTGYVAEYRSVEDLAAGLYWVLDQPSDAYEQLAQAARQFVLDHYEESVVAGRYRTLYEELIKGLPAPV